MEQEKGPVLRCIFRESNDHDIDKDSKCAREERYTIISTQTESSRYISSDGKIGSDKLRLLG